MRDVRLQEMEKVIRENGTVSMEELCRRFDVSMHTVRRDVAELEKRGVVEKVYGGVSASDRANRILPAFQERFEMNAEAKRACCQAAAGMIRDHDVIFVDSGTTCSSLLEFVDDAISITVVTHNLQLIQSAVQHDNVQLILLPGQLCRKTLSLTGVETVSSLKQYNIQKAFMATTGSTERTVTNSFPNEFEIKQAVMTMVPEKILLMTSEKFGHPGLMNYASFSEFQTVITDRLPEEPYLSSLRESGVRLLVAGEREHETRDDQIG